MRNIAVETEIQNIDHYFSLPDNTVVFVRDLLHQAPILVKEAKETKNLIIYGGKAKKKSTKNRWIYQFTVGKSSPKTMRISFSNGVILTDYSLFDKRPDATAEEMLELAKYIMDITDDNPPITGCNIIQHMLKSPKINKGSKEADLEENGLILAFTKVLWMLEEDHYISIATAMRGGANSILDNKDKTFAYETHIDFHQLYAHEMITNRFPATWTNSIKIEYREKATIAPTGSLCIYEIAGGRARLKKDGYPLISSGDDGFKMFGDDGEWHDIASELLAITQPDMEILQENYDIENLVISARIEYLCSFDGNRAFGKVVKELYKLRSSPIKSIKSFGKLMGEYLAGYFERSTMSDGVWDKDYTNNNTNYNESVIINNPIIGAFITAYGRRDLNRLLHMFKKEHVIGYDTDCAFINLPVHEVERLYPQVVSRFGPGIGELHFDGLFSDVVHKASKSYTGYDLENKEFFSKVSGKSKSGYTWYWDKQERLYKLKGDKDTDENR